MIAGVNVQVGNPPVPDDRIPAFVICNKGEIPDREAWAIRLIDWHDVTKLERGNRVQLWNEDGAGEMPSDDECITAINLAHSLGMYIIYGGDIVDGATGLSKPPRMNIVKLCDIYGVHCAIWCPKVPVIMYGLPTVVTEVEQDPAHVDWNAVVTFQKRCVPPSFYFTLDWLNQSVATSVIDLIDAPADIIKQIGDLNVSDPTPPMIVPPVPTPVLEDQGFTYRCGVFAVTGWFEGYRLNVKATKAYGTYCALADAQQGLAFSDVHQYVDDLAAELGVQVQWWNDGYIKDFPNFDQLVRDKWCVTIGVEEADLKPTQDYYHYIDIDGLDGNTFDVVDSFHLYDGEAGQESVESVHKAIQDNWDTTMIGIAFRLELAA